MRLTSQQVRGIEQALEEFVRNIPASLYLFGSRTKDHLKGGDIDLLLVTQEESISKLLKSRKHEIIASIHSQIGEQKVDLKIASEDEINVDPFLKAVFPQAVLICRW